MSRERVVVRYGFLFSIALAVLVVGSSAQKGSGKADAQTFQHSEWTYLPPEEIIVNLYDLRNVVAVRTRTRTRNNAVVEQQASFLLGVIHIQHAPANLFNQTATDSLRHAAEAEGQFRQLLGRRDKRVELADSRDLYAFGERGGWLHIFDLVESGQTCYASRTGFLSDSGKNWDAAERYDTIVMFYDCSAHRSLHEIETWLKGMRLVSSEYNARRMKK